MACSNGYKAGYKWKSEKNKKKMSQHNLWNNRDNNWKRCSTKNRKELEIMEYNAGNFDIAVIGAGHARM